MRAKVSKIVLLVALVPMLYWGVTAAMIENSARYISTRHSCIVWIPFDHTGYLVSMGQRSIPSLHRQIGNPSVGMSSKIHLAWVLGRLGDYSQFPSFINGLQSKKQQHQYIAASRMQDFPNECLRYLPAILAAGRQKQHSAYWGLLMLLAHKSGLPSDKQETLLETIGDLQMSEKGLSAQDAHELRQQFGASTN